MKKSGNYSQNLQQLRLHATQRAQESGVAATIEYPQGGFELFTAMPELPVGQLGDLRKSLQELQTKVTTNPEDFQSKTSRGSFVLSNDLYMSDTVKQLISIPHQFTRQNKLNVAIIVGQGNFESMTLEMLNHAHLVLFIDIDPVVIEYNLYSSKLLQSNEDYTDGILDSGKNPLFKREVYIPQRSGYIPGQVEKVKTMPRQKITPEYFASMLRDAATQTFDRYALLATKLRLVSEGERTHEGYPLLDDSVLQQLNQFVKQYENSDDLKAQRSQFDRLHEKLKRSLKNAQEFTNEDALCLRKIIRDVSYNKYFMAGDFRFEVCRTASRQLQFAGLQLDLFDQHQVASLAEIFKQHNVVVSVINVTNLYYYDNKTQPFLPGPTADAQWQTDGRLLESLGLLTDHLRTIILFSSYANINSQALLSRLCLGIAEFNKAMSENMTMLCNQLKENNSTPKVPNVSMKNLKAKYAQAVTYLSKKEYPQAITILHEILFLFPENTEERALCHSTLASCFRDTGKLQDALTQCEEAMNIVVDIQGDLTKIKTKYSGCLQQAKPNLEKKYEGCEHLYLAEKYERAAVRLSCLIGVFGKIPSHSATVRKCEQLLDKCAEKLIPTLMAHLGKK